MIERVRELLVPVVEKEGVFIDDIEYVKENNDNYLRIYLDKDGGIDLITIVDISPIISDLLDEYDLIADEYFLEVSSPGAEKKLKSASEIEKAISKYIRVEFKDPKMGMDNVEGYLKSFDNEKLKIEYRVKNIKKEIEVDYENVKLARLAIKF